MALNPRTAFRRTAFAAVAGASLLGAFPAVAQQANTVDYQGSPACASVKDAVRGIKCEINESVRRTDAANAQAAAADQRAARANQEAAAALAASECVKFLTAGVTQGTFNKAEILEKAGGKLTTDNACPVAKIYGYGRKAEAASPAPGQVN